MIKMIKNYDFSFKDIIIIGLLFGALWTYIVEPYFIDKENDKVVTVIIPPKEGTTGNQIINNIIKDTIYIDKDKETIIVDKTYKDLYLQSKDSITKLNLFLTSIKINDYKKDLVDNDTIKITGTAKTRGELLEYKIDYYIKPFEYTYKPEVIYKRPSLQLGLLGEFGVSNTFDKALFKGNINLVNSKGNGLSLGYDTDKRIWIGYQKMFTLKK